MTEKEIENVHGAFLHYLKCNNLSKTEFLFINDIWRNIQQYLREGGDVE